MFPETTFMPLEFLRPLWLLGIPAVFLFSFIGYKTAKRSRQQGLIAPHLSENLVTAPGQSSKQRIAFPLLAMIASVALAGPSFRSLEMPVYEMEKAQVLVLDLSYSMYASDLKPNRLTQAKYKAIDLIKKWSEGEKALITYAGDAFTISPLTPDGNSIINHIPHLSPDIMPVKGSRADLALERAITLLKNSGYTQGHIVFFSDNIAPQTSKKMLKQLKGSNWVVSILAMGTEQGAPIKLPDGSLLKNQQDEIVVPRLNKQPLYDISRSTDGLYLTAGNNNADIERLSRHFRVKDAHKDKTQQSGQTEFAKDDGYWLTFLLLPLFLLLFRRGVFYALLLTLTIPLSSPRVEASIWKNDQQNAFQAYRDKEFASAAQLYDEPMAKGSALYQNKQYQEALEQFQQATLDKPDNADAFYNQGNAYAQLQEFDKAIQAYQQALTINPEFKAARENKKLLEELKKQQEQQQQQNSEQQNSEQQNSEQQNSEQQNSEQQNSEQQNSEQQNSEQQNSEQQNSEQQNSEQQNSEQQNSEQQKAEQQKAEQQKAEQQKAEQQKAEQQKAKQQKVEQQKQKDGSQQDKQAAAVEEMEQKNQELEELPNWLKNMPDDPSLLLRNKMRLEYQKRAQSQSAKKQSNGDIW